MSVTIKLTDMRDNVFLSVPLDCSAQLQGVSAH